MEDNENYLLVEAKKTSKKSKKVQNIIIDGKNDKKISFIEMIYIFSICSVIGYFVEIGYVFLAVGRLVNRGLLYGPYCPIYGFGGVILYLLFYNLKRDKRFIPYAFFVASVVLGSFELLCGLGFKHIFNIEMWNYSGQFLEILNYTTVPILIGWGILGTLYVFFLQPILIKLINFIPKSFSKRLAYIILLVFLFDLVLSIFKIINNAEILYKLVNP